MAEILNMQNICKSYSMGEEEIEVLHNVNLTIQSGEFISILGPSGSGKTTMMNIIGCLDVPTTGKYLLVGNDIYDLDEIDLAKIRNKEIGFVFQSFHLLPRMNKFLRIDINNIAGDRLFCCSGDHIWIYASEKSKYFKSNRCAKKFMITLQRIKYIL